MTAGIKKRVGIVQASINTLANCSCLLDYGVGEDYKVEKPTDL